MSGLTNEIVRIAARGDGVTADGRHFAFAVSGDVVDENGAVVRGPHHVDAPCRHFRVCGGCQLQHADEAALADYVTTRVTFAAEGQGIAIGELLPTHLSPPRSRRRATLHGLRKGGASVLGFRESGSHRIVDMRECHILRPELFALVTPLRELIARFGGAAPIDVSLTSTVEGVDCGLTGMVVEGLLLAEELPAFARRHGLGRLWIDQGYGPEILWEPEPLVVEITGARIALPPGSFLQPTADGEAMLINDARSYLEGCEIIADLFSGLGTFAVALSPSARTLAVEASQTAHLALKSASMPGRSVHALHRDLFRNPLQPEELNRFDAVLLDPPRAGAQEQVRTIAASNLARVAYVSCNPSTWARDAKVLAAAGFKLAKLRPVGQFRWSTHVELTSLFVR